MNHAQRLCLRILLWLAAAVILTVLGLLIIMEVNLARHDDGGEMVDGIALFLGLVLIVYYSIVLILGRLMLRRGGAAWGWYLVVCMLMLLFVPVVVLWKWTHGWSG